MGFFFHENTCTRLPEDFCFVWLKVVFVWVTLLIMFTVLPNTKQFQEIELSIDLTPRLGLGTIDLDVL